MEIIALCVLAYLFVSPDKKSLAFSRGLAGAARGGITGRTRKTSKTAKPSPRGRAMLAGWKEGIATARERREAGRDLWSRSTRGAGRLAGGTGSLVRGVRDTVAARNSRDDDSDTAVIDGAPDAVPARRGWIGQRLVRRPRTTPTSDASGLVIDQDGNDVTPGDGKAAEPETETSPDTAGKTADPPNTDATVTEPQITAEPERKPDDKAPSPSPATTTRTAPNGAITMPQSELSTVDELANEIKTMENVFTDLSEAIARAKKWGANLPDRWAAANWGTKGLDTAVMDISEEIAGIKLVPLDSFGSVRSEITKARTLGETADAIQARGKTEAFRAS